MQRKDGAVPPIRLERLSVRRQAEFLALAKSSRAFHRPWIHPPATPKAFAAYLRRGRGVTQRSFFIVGPGRELAGVINVSEIVRGAFRSAYLGYYLFKPFARRGYMSEALSLALNQAFGVLGLHRVEANIQPGNRASLRLVKGLG